MVDQEKKNLLLPLRAGPGTLLVPLVGVRQAAVEAAALLGLLAAANNRNIV